MMAVVQGFALGLAFAAPIGAQNVYVIRSAANAPLRLSSRVAALVSLADIALGLACLFGIGAIFTTAPWLTTAITAVGATFLLFIGLLLLLKRPQPMGEAGEDSAQAILTWPRIAGTVIVLTWFNPQALIDGTLILGGFRTQLSGNNLVQFAAGMASASLLWFHVLTFGVGVFRKNFGDTTMRWVNRVCGFLLCVLGVQLGITLFA